MRVFVTGASGFIGFEMVKDLLAGGHQVLGLARSDQSAEALSQVGAEVHRGELADVASLVGGAKACEAVIHCGFIHDFTNFAANCEIDKNAIEAFGATLEGSGRPLIVVSGTNGASEDDPALPFNPALPRVSELTAMPFASRGVRVSVVRVPQVHDLDKQGLIAPLIEVARQKGVSAYVGEGLNAWPAVHRLDCARIFRLVLEKGTVGGRYHAIAEEGVTARDIAEVIGRRLNIPVVSKTAEEAPSHFGWLGFFIGRDLRTSSNKTQERLGWRPTGPGLIEDLNHAHNLEP